MSSCYSCKFNEATVKKLGKSFDVPKADTPWEDSEDDPMDF